MHCDKVLDHLSDYCEGTLPPALRAAVQGHLDACASCRAEAEGLQDVWQLLDTVPEVEPPADFRTMVWQRIEAEQARGQATRRPRFVLNWRMLLARPIYGFAAAAALLLLVLATTVVPGHFRAAGIPAWLNPFARPPVQITVGQPTGMLVDGAGTLVVPLQAASTHLAEAEVRIVGGPQELIGRKYPVTFSAGRATVHLPNLSKPMVIRVTWEEKGRVFSVEHSLPVVPTPSSGDSSPQPLSDTPR